MNVNWMNIGTTNGAYVNDSEGYAIAKAKYSDMLRVYGVTGVKFHTTENRIEVTKTERG